MSRAGKRSAAHHARTDKVEVNKAGLMKLLRDKEATDRMVGLAVAIVAGRELDRTFTRAEVDAVNGAEVRIEPTAEGGLRVSVHFKEQVVDALPQVEL